MKGALEVEGFRRIQYDISKKGKKISQKSF